MFSVSENMIQYTCCFCLQMFYDLSPMLYKTTIASAVCS